LVGGSARIAELAARSDWLGARFTLEGALPAGARAVVAVHHARAGLMEHASIAAFARFALQLLALGAPAELVERAHEAIGDETRHARICFALASAYAGHPMGPGALRLEGAVGEVSLEECLRLTVREGCVGETVAALEAREAAERARDPALRATLRAIAEDELRHAELAWRFVRWAIARAPELAEVLHVEIAHALDEARRPEGEPRPGPFEEHGVLSEQTRRAVRDRALREIVAPVARALFRSTVPRSAPVSLG
jgi:hypothetical protein